MTVKIMRELSIRLGLDENRLTDLLVQQGLEDALNGGASLPENLSDTKKKSIMGKNVDVKIEDEDQALLLLCSLPESFESFVETILFGRTSITLEDVTASLNLRELKHEVKEVQAHGSNGEGLIAKERQSEKGSRSRTIEWIPKEKYLDILGYGRVNQCKEYTMAGKSSKSLMRRYVAFDEVSLTKQCKSAS
ncbi:hypothetical protein CRG98_019472 [Punica granatum]|uniref:Retrovirus-related Pol polyprotein from transposon TNT 1-94 n=1 Tax=Punica granatum TaxID=22663 RepID=A0A2I0JUZ0_PUNGR|nr:hypothetical protein CRG98_019472 [Punica granatum]